MKDLTPIFNEETATDNPDLMTDAEIKAACAQIFADYFADIPPRDQPWLMYVTGLPGAGKTCYAATVFERQAFDVHLNFDDLRRYHPRYAQLAQTDPVTAAARTDIAVEKLFTYAINECRRRRLSLLLDDAPVDPNATSGLLSAFKSDGYVNTGIILAVPADIAAQSVRTRFEDGLKNTVVGVTPPRYVNSIEQAAAPEILFNIAERFVSEQLVHQAAVIGRDGHIFWGGHISNRDDLVSIVRRETERKTAPAAKQAASPRSGK